MMMTVIPEIMTETINLMVAARMMTTMVLVLLMPLLQMIMMMMVHLLSVCAQVTDYDATFIHSSIVCCPV